MLRHTVVLNLEFAQVLAVLEEEAVEREARMADREATTAENLIKHREEIMARPARTWFMTPAEKREAAVAAKAAAEVKLPPTAPGAAAAAAARPASKQEAAAAALKKTEARPHRMTRKKRRRLEALAAEDKEARRITKLEADAAKQNKAAAGAGVGGAKLKKVAKGAGSGSGGGGAGAGASGQAVSDDEAPAPLLDKETAKAKKRLEATMMASTQQHAIARRAKHAARDEANKLGVTPNALAKLRAKEAKHKKKAKQGRGSHAPAGPGAASSSHDASGGGSAFASEARDASALAVHAFKKHGTGFMKHQQHGRKSFKSQKRFKRR
jgi:ATP-dependent RNA helicase DDX27